MKINIILGCLLSCALVLTEAAVNSKLMKAPAALIAAQNDPKNTQKVTIRENFYFVEFKAPPNTQAAKKEQEDFLKFVKEKKLPLKIRYQFIKNINAISFHVEREYLDDLGSLPAIQRFWPMIFVSPPQVKRAENDILPKLFSAHSMTGVTEVHDTLGLKGKGIKVGIIDSGVDYHHPALGGCFGKGCRVAYGYDFVGDDYNGTNELKPDNDPDDNCQGHGTHVAGIIGANSVEKGNSFVGVAPEVTFGAYRLFGCKGSTASDIIIAALERAYDDGMDVVNLSLGGGSSWADYPHAAVATKLSEKGMTVVASIGNSGDKGLWEAGSPGLGRGVIGVASFDNLRYLAYSFFIKSDPKKINYDYASSTPAKIDLKDTPFALALSDDKSELGCTPITSDVKGKIALIIRGTCNFVDKAKNAQSAGAVAVFIYNNKEGIIAPGVEDPEVKIPVVGLLQSTGLSIKKLLETSKDVTPEFLDKQVSFPTPTGGQTSDFSSWGLGPELEIKPDIGGPGGLIYSTYPLKLGGFATLSGTSMSSPYVAGSAAIYIEKFGKKTDPKAIKVAFQNAAIPAVMKDQKFLIPVAKEGAGLINIKNALLANTIVNPSRLALNDTIRGDRNNNRIVTITNNSKKTVTYTLTHKAAGSVKGYENGKLMMTPPNIVDIPATVSFPQGTKITVKAGKKTNVQIAIKEPAGLKTEDHGIFSGFVVFTPNNNEPPIHVSYAGLKGNLASIPVMDREGFPMIATMGSDKTWKDPNETTDAFSFKEKDTPVVLVRLTHPTKLISVRLTDASGKKELGVIHKGNVPFMGRNDNSPDNLFHPIEWNGNYVERKAAIIKRVGYGKLNLIAKDDAEEKIIPAPDGAYRLKVVTLKPFGNPEKESDYESWLSPSILVKRSAEPATPPVTTPNTPEKKATNTKASKKA